MADEIDCRVTGTMQKVPQADARAPLSPAENLGTMVNEIADNIGKELGNIFGASGKKTESSGLGQTASNGSGPSVLV
jgi:hypothetical protein